MLRMTNTMNTPPRFGEWAAVVSQRTNRSLAGRRITLPPATRHDADAADSGRAWRQFRSEAAQWGMIASDADVHAAHSPDACTPAGGDAPLDPRCPVTQLFDSRHAAGVAAMDYAQEHMPVTAALLKTLTGETDLDGVRIAVCLILEPKTAVLLRLLQAAGATVGVYCEPESTDQRVADQLRREGIMVQADAGWTAEQAHQGALRLLDEIRPQIIIDDGASFARLAALERPQLLDNLVGVSEETTSGVRAFEAMRDAGALTFPVIAVNDSIMKTGFDNAHGTGETCVTTMQDILGARAFDGARVTVVGYGPVGRGFAMRIRTLGAQVTICDTNPVAALRAVFDGFAATDIDKALPQSDIVVSATGVRHTIALEHLRRMRQGTALAVIGGIANEIALDDIPDFHGEPGTRIRDLAVPEGPVIRLLAEGDGVNYTAGGGNPIEIMDLSFAVQVSAVDYLWRTRGTLAPGLHRLDADADRRIAAMALSVRGFRASHAVANNGYDWTMTRFAETERRSRTQEGR